MANARALDRAAAGLPPKDTWILDFNVGGIVQVLIVLIAAWFLSAFVDEFPVWPRQSLLLAVYLLIVGAGYFI
jgi:hypothetical protein